MDPNLCFEYHKLMLKYKYENQKLSQEDESFKLGKKKQHNSKQYKEKKVENKFVENKFVENNVVKNKVVKNTVAVENKYKNMFNVIKDLEIKKPASSSALAPVPAPVPVPEPAAPASEPAAPEPAPKSVKFDFNATKKFRK